MRMQVTVEVEAHPGQSIQDVAHAVVEVLRISGMDPESDHFGPPIELVRVGSGTTILELMVPCEGMVDSDYCFGAAEEESRL